MTKPQDDKEKTITIVVNGTPYEVPKKDELTYAEVVTLAFADFAQNPQMTYSVTYTRGHNNKPEGVLDKGDSVKAKKDMQFRVNRTGQS